MGKISLMQLSNEEINTDEVAQKNDLPKSYYHKFMFEFSKKQSKVRFIVIDVLSRSPKTDHGTT